MAIRVISRVSPSGAANILKSEVSQDLGTFPGNSPTTVLFLVPGAQVGDSVLVNPTLALPDDIFIVHFHVETADEVQVEFFNINGGDVVVGTQTMLFTLFRG